MYVSKNNMVLPPNMLSIRAETSQMLAQVNMQSTAWDRFESMGAFLQTCKLQCIHVETEQNEQLLMSQKEAMKNKHRTP